MAAKKAKTEAAPKNPPPRSRVSTQTGPVKLRAGGGSNRVQTRLIALYGGPKTRKTGSASHLPPDRTKWIITDSNCIPTLDVLGRLPPDENIYETGTLAEQKQLVIEMIGAAAEGGLGADFVVHDSITATNDAHQQDVARMTGQRFMGDNAKNNGWQQFNAEFGELLDLYAELARHVTVVMIGHAKEKFEPSKGEFNGLNLPPQMALKLGRLANWVLFKHLVITPMSDDEAAGKEPGPVDDYVEIEERSNGLVKVESVIHTKPYGLWLATTNARNLNAEEPPNLAKILEAEGLL